MAFVLPPRLWIYTNYDCNLSCSYCVVRSHPKAEPRAIEFDTFRRLIEEALDLEFHELYLTGGEPFLHPRFFDLLDYAVPRIKTTILTNATVVTPRRLERFKNLPPEHLSFQISVDSADPARNDSFRGSGSWERTMAGVEQLMEFGFRPKIGGTVTPETEGDDQDLIRFFAERGLAESNVFLRPLIKRGFSSQGKELFTDRVLPEVCVDRDGVYWHPLSTDSDFLVTRDTFPFHRAVALFREEMARREREGIESLPYQ